MGELENLRNRNIVSFTKMQVEESAAILKVSVPMIKKCLTSLLRKDFLRRVSRSNYAVNPLTFYRGKSKDVLEKYKMYTMYNKGIDKSE